MSMTPETATPATSELTIAQSLALVLTLTAFTKKAGEEKPDEKKDERVLRGGQTAKLHKNLMISCSETSRGRATLTVSDTTNFYAKFAVFVQRKILSESKLHPVTGDSAQLEEMDTVIVKKLDGQIVMTVLVSVPSPTVKVVSEKKEGDKYVVTAEIGYGNVPADLVSVHELDFNAIGEKSLGELKVESSSAPTGAQLVCHYPRGDRSNNTSIRYRVGNRFAWYGALFAPVRVPAMPGINVIAVEDTSKRTASSVTFNVKATIKGVVPGKLTMKNGGREAEVFVNKPAPLSFTRGSTPFPSTITVSGEVDGEQVTGTVEVNIPQTMSIALECKGVNVDRTNPDKGVARLEFKTNGIPQGTGLMFSPLITNRTHDRPVTPEEIEAGIIFQSYGLAESPGEVKVEVFCVPPGERRVASSEVPVRLPAKAPKITLTSKKAGEDATSVTMSFSWHIDGDASAYQLFMDSGEPLESPAFHIPADKRSREVRYDKKDEPAIRKAKVWLDARGGVTVSTSNVVETPVPALKPTNPMPPAKPTGEEAPVLPFTRPLAAGGTAPPSAPPPAGPGARRQGADAPFTTPPFGGTSGGADGGNTDRSQQLDEVFGTPRPVGNGDQARDIYRADEPSPKEPGAWSKFKTAVREDRFVQFLLCCLVVVASLAATLWWLQNRDAEPAAESESKAVKVKEEDDSKPAAAPAVAPSAKPALTVTPPATKPPSGVLQWTGTSREKDGRGVCDTSFDIGGGTQCRIFVMGIVQGEGVDCASSTVAVTLDNVREVSKLKDWAAMPTSGSPYLPSGKVGAVGADGKLIEVWVERKSKGCKKL